MSAENLKFFDDKSTEEIINWMINNLSEDQIRMCLTDSDISELPEKITEETQPAPEVPVVPVVPEVPETRDIKKISAIDRFIEKERKKCGKFPMVIETLTKDPDGKFIYVYYEFAEKDGEPQWYRDEKAAREFVKLCDDLKDEDKEMFELFIEENEDAFRNAPPTVLDILRDYESKGINIPVLLKPLVNTVEKAMPEEEITEQIEITPEMVKAIAVQTNKRDYLRDTYPMLYDRGITIYPVFVHGSEGNQVNYLAAKIVEGTLILQNSSADARLLNTVFNKITKELNGSIESGSYNPTDNMVEEINEAIKMVDPRIRNKIKAVYNSELIENYSFFGNVYDESSEEEADTAELIDFDSVSKQVEEKPSKKASEMSEEELLDRMTRKFGKEYAKNYKPEIYTNALGVKNVRYVRSKAENSQHEVDLFPGFGTTESPDMLF